MKHYSIKDLEKYSGIKAHTIRIWEKRYGIIEPSRTGTNIRYYSNEDLKRILNVAMLNRHGYRISNIAELTEQQITVLVTNLGTKESEYERYLDSLVAAMLDFDQPGFGRILSKIIHHMGFDETYREVIIPFFNRIGILWQSGSISPVQEHFISNIIRLKLYGAIEKIPLPEPNHGKTYLLLLPPNEYHEFGLLYLYYLLLKKGHQVIYLGQNTPFNGIKAEITTCKIDIIATAFTSPLPEDEFKEYVSQLSEISIEKPVYVSGATAENYRALLPRNMHFVRNFSEFPLS